MRKKLFKSESKRLLDLMINSIYTNKEIFLREIISNASDAIDKLHYVSLTDEAARKQRKNGEINISFDKDARTITVSDNGIGMTADELEENLGTIAKSGSLKFKEQMDKKDRDDSEIIGQFGVGFYSAFMVAKELTVISRSYKDATAHIWQSEGASGYTIDEAERKAVGTDIIMHLKDDTQTENYSEYLSEYRIKDLVKTYSDYIRHPIKLPVEKRKEVGEGDNKTFETYTEVETVNSMVPIWQRSKKQVPDEECFKFYKDRFYDFNDPVSVIRINADGLVSYKAMLFIPSKAPYDYFTKEYKKGLALYSNGVMIMENCAELLGEHFRFIKGVVDTNDLSLNISREMLQQSHELKTIANNIEKKIKAELKKLLEKERDKYLQFYNAFGIQLKYGIVANYGMNKEDLLDFIMFYSAKNEKLITLKEYAENMLDDQQTIYYSCGETLAAAKGIPAVELATLKGYDVLYLTDEVDEFVMKTLMTYNEKKIMSVLEENNGLVSDEDVKKAKEQTENAKELLDFIKTALDGAVSEVALVGSLKNFAAALNTKGGITLEMEKYFAAMPGENHPKAEKVLELNPEHSAYKAIEAAYKTDPEKAKKYAKILHGEALLSAGLTPTDTTEFCTLVSELIK